MTKAVDKVAIFISELLGTALLIFLGCMGCLSWGGPPASALQVSLSFGMVVMLIIQMFGCVSGAHLNPVVTLASVVYDMLSVQMACFYCIAQMCGAFMGYGLLIVITPTNIFRFTDATGPGLCVTAPHADLSAFQAFAIEYLATTVLIMLCCGVWDPRNANHQDSIPLKFGFAITAIGCILGPFTGASMNPARSFGPALWNHDFTSHWIYWAGPLPAGVITAILYKKVFRREVDTSLAVSDEDRKVHPNGICRLKDDCV